MSAILVPVDLGCGEPSTGKRPWRLQSRWDEDSPSLRQQFQITFMKCPMLLEIHVHWGLWCKPSLLSPEVSQGPRAFRIWEEVHLALAPQCPQEPPKCSLWPNVAWSFPQEGPYFPTWGWNVPESPGLTPL